MVLVHRTADTVEAAKRILDAAGRGNVPATEIIGIVQTVAGHGNIAITRDHGGDKVRDRPLVAHEAGMYVGPGSIGLPYTDVVAAINTLARGSKD